jgi:hypothetical protein
MKKTIWQTLMPHVIAVVIFLLVAVIFCKPALESGVVLNQYDIANWQGMSHQSYQYKEKHGHVPLWSVSMYSGMPAFQIAMEGPWTPLGIFDKIFQLGLPKPFNFFFLACVGFYFLCQCLRIRPWVSIIAAIGFAYCSFDPMVVNAGHDTQILALGYAPAVLGAVFLLFDKKYISGFILTTLLTALQIGQGHQQISYYLFLIIGIMSVFLLVQAIKRKETGPFIKGVSLAVAAGIVGVMVNAVALLPVYDYSKESKRGGQLVLGGKANSKEVIQNNKTKGLSKEYAFQWSYGRVESLSLLFPGVQGYGAHLAERDGEPYLFPKLDENSHTAKYFTEKLNLPEEQAANEALQLSRNIYWGDQPFTDAPIYMGAIVVFLFIFSMIYLKDRHKWWILTCAFLGILMALGENLAGFNYFLFDHMPMYNKFRVPTMALVIPQLMLPLGMALGLDKLVSNPDAEAWSPLRVAGFVMAGIFAVAAILYVTFDYSKENKKRTTAFSQAFTPSNPFNQSNPRLQSSYDSLNRAHPPKADNQLYENFVYKAGGDASVARGVLTALRKDRQAAFGGDILRSLLFVLVAFVILTLFIKKKITVPVMLAGIGLFTTIDLLTFGSKFLNSYSFSNKDNYEASEFPLTAADQAILQDPDPNYRVLNQTVGDPYTQDSRTSYYHKSIGGYHPARLGIYDDLIQYQLSGDPNPMVINMLNTKYVVQRGQNNAPMAARNPGALGNVWFVQNIKYVKGPAEEMQALNNFNPAETAIVDEAFKKQIPNTFTAADSAASIKQVAFDNDAVKYESNSNGAHLAVFSEIYYKDWKAYIDGKPAEYGKANYVLRAMVIPAGKHTIEFKFEPGVYYTSSTITAISSWLLGYIGWLLLPVIKKNKAVA